MDEATDVLRLLDRALLDFEEWREAAARDKLIAYSDSEFLDGKVVAYAMGRDRVRELRRAVAATLGHDADWLARHTGHSVEDEE